MSQSLVCLFLVSLNYYFRTLEWFGKAAVFSAVGLVPLSPGRIWSRGPWGRWTVSPCWWREWLLSGFGPGVWWAMPAWRGCFISRDGHLGQKLSCNPHICPPRTPESGMLWEQNALEFAVHAFFQSDEMIYAWYRTAIWLCRIYGDSWNGYLEIVSEIDLLSSQIAEDFRLHSIRDQS